MASSSIDVNAEKSTNRVYTSTNITIKKVSKQEINNVTFDLTKITILTIIALIKENTHDIKLGFKLDNNTMTRNIYQMVIEKIMNIKNLLN